MWPFEEKTSVSGVRIYFVYHISLIHVQACGGEPHLDVGECLQLSFYQLGAAVVDFQDDPILVLYKCHTYNSEPICV